ncbi:MAG: phospholipase D-like domain-containing protein [Tahibacter sp.]
MNHSTSSPATHSGQSPLRRMAEQAFSRAAGSPLSGGNRVELLIDAQAHFDAWLTAIVSARHSVLLENYIIRDDTVGRRFRDALIERAAAGVRVFLLRDWLGCFREARRAYWNSLIAAGVEVRVWNPPRFDSPTGWISRDHRKLLVVDGTVGFVSGVCLSEKWLGNSAKSEPPWRDTGVVLHGPAVTELASAFADSWAQLGSALPAEITAVATSPAGDVDVRVIATVPATAGLFRLDQLIAAMARKRLWLTDAYFVGLAPYVQALGAAARDGVDVRLLVPGASDIPAVARLSRAGYRPLLESGVRVYEWNGSMLHAKTAVCDSRWARVGSSNLNIASWLGNCEIDIAVENADFAKTMEAQYEADLRNATEIVLKRKRVLRGADGKTRVHRGGGSSGRAAAGMLRLAHNVGAALGNQRVLGRAEAASLPWASVVLTATAVIGLIWPSVIAWPLAIVLALLGFSLFARFVRAHRDARQRNAQAPTVQADAFAQSASSPHAASQISGEK